MFLFPIYAPDPVLVPNRENRLVAPIVLVVLYSWSPQKGEPTKMRVFVRQMHFQVYGFVWRFWLLCGLVFVLWAHFFSFRALWLRAIDADLALERTDKQFMFVYIFVFVSVCVCVCVNWWEMVLNGTCLALCFQRSIHLEIHSCFSAGWTIV